MQRISEVHHRDGAGGAETGQGDAVAADQGEHPRGEGHHQQQQLHHMYHQGCQQIIIHVSFSGEIMRERLLKNNSCKINNGEYTRVPVNDTLVDFAKN